MLLWREFLTAREGALAAAGHDPVIRRKLESLPRSRGEGDLHLALALCGRARGEREVEDRHLRAALVVEPGHREALYALGYSLAERGEFAEARPHLRRLLVETSEDGGAWLGLGLCAFHLREYEEAATALRQAAKLGHDNVNAYGMLTWCCAALGEYEDGVEFGERSLAEERKPVEEGAVRRGLAWSYRALALRAEEEEDLETAVRLGEKACTASPEEAVSWYALGRLLAQSSRWSEAEAPLRRALDLGYDEGDARQVLASVLFESGRAADAGREAGRCLELVDDASTRVWLHELAAAGREARRDLEGSLLHRREAVRLAPAKAHHAYNLAVTLIQLERFAEAAAELERALSFATTSEEGDAISAVLAQAWMGMGDVVRAEECLRALFDTAQHEAAIAQWVDLAVTRRRLSEALAVSRREVEQRPGSGVAHACLGYVLLHLGQDEEAHLHFRQAGRLHPRDPWVEWLTQGRMEKVQFPCSASEEG